MTATLRAEAAHVVSGIPETCSVVTRPRPLLLCDWDRALMIHYEVDARHLQPRVPYPLDTFNGKAWVTMVAFTMKWMRPRFGGRILESLLRPIATHEFLNVRTYVRGSGNPGIYFLAEWVPNRLSALLAGRTFGLPYRPGELKFEHHHERGELLGKVRSFDSKGTLEYRSSIRNSFVTPAPGSRTEFFMERYHAYTFHGNVRRRFQIWHPPWRQTGVDLEIRRDDILNATGGWFRHARYACANYSPGFRDVGIGRPE